MKIWLVGVSDCEGNSIICACATKKIAEIELFKERDGLIKKWKKMDKYLKEYKHGRADETYPNMIKAISSNDYENWDNFPHECPYICEMEVKQSARKESPNDKS